ncbi:hypothetical protein WHZ78_16660 [Bradyrhizobium symbiodeficiens]|uniref:hypothetical protein n=1 Tax=Bradyrhizobium symbiodeficiens TaxID=1404367 RepID=UPI0030D59F54
MKPSTEMTASPAFTALSARSVLQILLEEFAHAAGQPLALSTAFLEAGGAVANAQSTGTRELVARSVISIWTLGTTSRTFSLSDRWRAISDQASAVALLAEARAKAAAKRPVHRPRKAPKAPAENAGSCRALPVGVRRSTWPAMPWLQGDAS